jgi:xylulokinase
MGKDLVIGVDASTTGCKAIVWDLKGTRVSQGRGRIPLLRPRPSWHEQDARDWWQTLAKSLRIAVGGINPDQIAGLCICPQRETFVPVNKDGNPLRNAILWMDVRARLLMQDFQKDIEADRFHKMTGKPLSGNLTLLKIRWLQENEPAIFQEASKFVDVAAYLNFCMTGHWGTGWGVSGPTGLFNLVEMRWSEDVLDYLGLEAIHFPISYQTGAVVGYVTDRAAQKCDLRPGLPVLAGLGDGQAGGLGLNVTHPGGAYLSLGTSVVSGTYSQRYVTNPAFRTMIAGVPGAYSLETVILGGTYTIDWFFEFIGDRFSLDELDEKAKDLPPGAEGLILVPYWNSALTPYWDAQACGHIVGWRGHHTPFHLYRAILEGIAFELRLHFEGVQNILKKQINKLIVMGGGAQNDTWCQILADVIGIDIQRSATTEATALGAGMIAACGTGYFEDFRSAGTAMAGEVKDRFNTRPQIFNQYSELYQGVYKGLYPAMRPLTSRLAELAHKEV